MRLTGMSRMAKGIREADQPNLSADLEEMLEHLKWNLWHGKVDRALEITDELAYALDVENGSPEHRKLLKAVRAFEGYIRANRALIPNSYEADLVKSLMRFFWQVSLVLRSAAAARHERTAAKRKTWLLPGAQRSLVKRATE
jgi:hypothetical protein